ncbi:hypothetical protein QUF84_23635 [Fictibacillus enclensis]|uniref:hypothetical protein n=1 Tax=Fictibacillus enclensis TaxID=1017270 RepID=UPI0024C063CE|nr:hypothetical protein [Fictibacillus enclensis]MDM5340197.1 hypothetical protein [Fictibacillus enclensis]WHY71714.1 hypothetical protein QNH15_22390 [Fictibacillus enclensis]
MTIIKNQRKFFILAAVLLVSLAGLGWYYLSTASVTEEVEATEPGGEVPYSTLIDSTHQYYNKTLCYDKDETINWADQQTHAIELVNEIRSVTVKSETVKKDFQNARELAEIVSKEKDKTALLYLHRIFHDLDKAVNHYKQKDDFGYTYTGTGKRLFGGGVNKVEHYLAENKK